MNPNNIIIGTANFGSKYGYKKKLFSPLELKEIFKILKQNNIYLFDTAQSYGISEKILGKYIKKKKIFTKIIIPNIKSSEIEYHLNQLINKSLNNLKTQNIEGILIHNSDFFIKNKVNQKKIINLLKKYKKKKIINKIGFSLYTPDELHKITRFFIPDFFQIPINILDQRFLKTNIVNKIKKLKIEIHARSIFLQGKILKKKQFKSVIVNKKITKFHKWCTKNKVSKISACINFIKNYKFLNKTIFGIDNKLQLKEILKYFKEDEYQVPKIFEVKNYNLIDPRKM